MRCSLQAHLTCEICGCTRVFRRDHRRDIEPALDYARSKGWVVTGKTKCPNCAGFQGFHWKTHKEK